MNVSENGLREMLRQAFRLGYESPIEDRESAVEKVLSEYREQQQDSADKAAKTQDMRTSFVAATKG